MDRSHRRTIADSLIVKKLTHEEYNEYEISYNCWITDTKNILTKLDKDLNNSNPWTSFISIKNTGNIPA